MRKCTTDMTGLKQCFQTYWGEFKAPVVSAWIAGALAYMFVLTNKIVNWDDMQFLFGKGYTLTSGRWGLDLIEYLLPSYSMPWLWGVFSIFVLSIAVCVMIRIFEIKSKVFQCLLAVNVLAFPSQIGTMLYMFTSSSYAVAFLLATISVRLYIGGGHKRRLLAIVALICACSIYQAYVAIAASFLVLLLIQKILRGETTVSDIVKQGVSYLVFLVVSLAVYYGITMLLLHVSDSELNGWAVRATTDENGVLYRVMRAWKLFAAMFVYRDYGLITTTPSWVAHILCGIIAGVLAFGMVLKQKNACRTLLQLALAGVLMPLSINCLVMLLGENGVHALTLYSFISVYIFVIIVLENIPEKKIKERLRNLTAAGLVVIAVSNIYTANKAYLKQYLIYENTFSFYETVVTQIQMTEGFDENSKIAIIGNIAQDSKYLDMFGEVPIYGLCGFKGEAISDKVITYYLGVDLNYATDLEKQQLKLDERVKKMSAYPYYGYVQKIDDYIVVKIGE